MADATAIEWCDSTFNPWIGCTKISPACDHCYAEAQMDTRMGRAEWGAGKPRVRTSAANWKKPLRWNREDFQQCGGCGWRGVIDTLESDCCPNCGKHERLDPARRRVFCASLADVFDNDVDPSWRDDLFELIAATPNLDWLLLTKRIGNVVPMLESCMLTRADRPNWFGRWVVGGYPPANVWLGATICNQAEADRDIPKLLAIPAAKRFVSIEPMLGPINFRWTPYAHEATGETYRQYLDRTGVVDQHESLRKIDWCIAGGESGPHARPSHPDWFRSLRDQCAEASVPFLFKQWGEWWPLSRTDGVHELPFGKYLPHADPPFGFIKRGKKAAGRLLDGIEHNGFPSASVSETAP